MAVVGVSLSGGVSIGLIVRVGGTSDSGAAMAGSSPGRSGPAHGLS
jgi:hypothetical protein